ncbi:hydrogenase maturation nickel metallochaperone HypA/HybF [Desulfovibrio sp. An276]|uniref:hydrogenase maturation nickel metallochaperone HypA/HybF n=1 Tax=Desulfovibrio sp. An276 TaxID=1965618 RepID=UPI001EF74539|nr:hydrogenase maturation nickel metallochaperone HypA [Desulfovibrio sp. An276]
MDLGQMGTIGEGREAMHELALAQGMLDIATEELSRHNCKRLTLLRVNVGAMSGVVPECLDFAFSSLVQGTVHEGARLEIVKIPLKLKCICGEEFEADNGPFDLPACPKCGEVIGHRVLAGKEMQVDWIEGE